MLGDGSVGSVILLNLELQDYIQFAIIVGIITILVYSFLFPVPAGCGWVRRWIYTVLYLYMYNVT